MSELTAEKTSGAFGSDGVQNLIHRIRDEGIKAAREEAERIVHEARQQAAEIEASSKAEARARLEQADSQIADQRAAAAEALKLAARC